MKHISLFSGIGGFDLAAQWAGWDNLASCEINPFGRRVLSHYWPEAYHHDDIKTLTGEIIDHEAQKRYGPDWRASGVILSGGFPCQPYSLAGKRLGKEDERHLWPEMCRIIREIKPDWIVGENVLGLVSWSDGLVFNEVQADLETAGYEVQAFVLPACAADAPHRRDRVWIVAHSANIGQKQSRDTWKWRSGLEDSRSNASWNDANTNDKGLQGSEKRGSAGSGWPERNKQPERLFRTDWKGFPTQPPVCPRDDGFSAELDGITFPKWRKESIKAAGNAIVPQIAYRIFQTINNFTHGTQSTNRPEQQHTGKITRTETGNASGE